MKEIDDEEYENNNNDNKDNNIKEQNQDKIKEGNILILSNNIENNIIKDDNDIEKQKSILLVKSKINELKNNYNFYIQYHNILFNMITYLQNLTYEKITNSINDSGNYLTFFQETSELYSKFAEEIKKSNDIIMSSKKLPKMNDNILLESLQNTQNIIQLNLSKISKGLKQNIISNGPFSKFQEKVNKIESIKNKLSKKFGEIEEKRKTLEKKYKNSYEKLFEEISDEKNNNKKDNDNGNNNDVENKNKNENENISLVDIPDLIYIIKDLLDDINNLILEINLFIIDIKDNLHSINFLFVEINDLVKDSVLIYIQESKNIFNIDVTKNFEQIQKYYKNLDEHPEEKIFKLDKIFNEQNHREKIFDLLEQYYNLLNDSKRVKKELIDRNNFSIKKYPNLFLFFEWLISISPQPSHISTDDLIIKKVELKRYSGFFGGWKESEMIITKQSHIIVYDKPVNYKFENIIQIFEIDKTNLNNKFDIKNPFLFEIKINNKGNVMNFTGTFLFDALNNENLYDISYAYKDYIDK